MYQRVLGREGEGFPSDTLVTKVLLGTLGCIPAYDRWFVRGLRDVGLPYSSLRPINFQKMVDYCESHKKSFELVRDEVNINAQDEGITYPIMKVVDMYFWMRGADLERFS